VDAIEKQETTAISTRELLSSCPVEQCKLLLSLIFSSASSWDRQVWLVENGVDDGFNSSVHAPGLSVIRKEDTVTRNVIINGYNGVWTIDHVRSARKLV
jgi:hypothetical protein